MQSDESDIATPPKHELAPYKALENQELQTRIEAARNVLGDQLLILGHHYQQDEVIEHADLRGDSYQLSQLPPTTRRVVTLFSAASISWPKPQTSSPIARRKSPRETANALLSFSPTFPQAPWPTWRPFNRSKMRESVAKSSILKTSPR